MTVTNDATGVALTRQTTGDGLYTVSPILPGTYELEVFLKDLGHHKIELVPQRLRFDVVESPIYGGRKIDAWYGQVGLRACAFAQAASLVSFDR